MVGPSHIERDTVFYPIQSLVQVYGVREWSKVAQALKIPLRGAHGSVPADEWAPAPGTRRYCGRWRRRGTRSASSRLQNRLNCATRRRLTAARAGPCDLVPASGGGLRSGMRPLSRLAALPRLLPYGTMRYRSQAMTMIARHLAHCRMRRPHRRRYLSQPECQNVQAVTLIKEHDLTEVILKRSVPHEPNPAKRAYAWLECPYAGCPTT